VLAVQADRDDGAVDELLQAEAARRPASPVVRLRRVERQLRRRYRDAAARQAALAELEALATEPGDDLLPGGSVERARVWFLLAAAYEDDPATAARAEDAYRRGLSLRPGHAVAACRLALLVLDRGDPDGALAELERALRIDAGFGLAWRNAARVLDATHSGLSALERGAGRGAPSALAEVVGRLLDAAHPGAGAAASSVAPRLLAATAEVARGDVLAGFHAHGHRVKNVLGIIGSRTRSARKLAGDGELSERLRELEREVTALYEEWAHYLRSMQAAGPTLEVVAVAPLLAGVVAAAGDKSPTPIELAMPAALPDLRGDRVLLREALLNLVDNAAEACASTGGEAARVTVSVRAVSAGGAPAVEVVVADTGPGIPRAELGKIFVPGYTTKETGSGVGLTIAERVVAAHHGRILVDSEEGRGTLVTVVLPTDLGGFATLGTPRGEPGGLA
jgi:signal transduction histidine kinase